MDEAGAHSEYASTLRAQLLQVWHPWVTSAGKATGKHMLFLRWGLFLNPESTHWLALLAGHNHSKVTCLIRREMVFCASLRNRHLAPIREK